ncbi:unnamed protein product [Rotaria sordida]|uniref:Uncharacterized protein n=1 Tax=Rotaria sordida TaxID=392033 RepID=A0A819F2L7_9BILA|nr:unnamed protein product [Rotaria sordida]
MIDLIQINNYTTFIHSNQNSNMLLYNRNTNNQLNRSLSADVSSICSSHRQRHRSSSESDIFSSLRVTPGSTSDQESSISSKRIAASLLFQRLIKRCKSSMKIAESTLEKAANKIFQEDQEVEIQWQKTFDFFMNERQCNNSERIENEIYECFNVLINDERRIMIGLDSISSLKDLLIASMRICTEPNFKLEIRIEFGGTPDLLTLRTPSYAIAGIYLLERLLQLREKFTLNQSHSAAVKVNNIDQVIGKQHANEMLLYIKMYIDHYHSNLSNFVQYEMDHLNTYQDKLLERIIEHYKFDYHDEQIKQELINQAISRGSNEQGSIRYTSMHLIIFKDIIDKNSSQSLFYLLDKNENNIQDNELICLYDSIITIGGPVEVRFNKVRHEVRQAFIKKSKKNNEENYHFPLSIRMLSKAGHTPVYYHNKSGEITVDQILKDPIIDLDLINTTYKDIKLDISILKEDIGISLLKSVWNHIPCLDKYNISTWENIVLTLTNLCLKVWQIHARNNNSQCQCLVKDQQAIDQICEHYHLLNDLNDDGRLIINGILNVLEKRFRFPFGQITERRRLNTLNSDNNTQIKITNKLDEILNQILINFIQTKFSSIT